MMDQIPIDCEHVVNSHYLCAIFLNGLQSAPDEWQAVDDGQFRLVLKDGTTMLCRIAPQNLANVLHPPAIDVPDEIVQGYLDTRSLLVVEVTEDGTITRNTWTPLDTESLRQIIDPQSGP